MKTQFDRITFNPKICHGKPCIRSLRYPVEIIYTQNRLKN